MTRSNVRLMRQQTVARIQRHLTADLLTPKWRKLNNGRLFSGHCYVASEALWHLLGGRDSGWTPQVLTHERWPEGLGPGETHWYLRNGGEVLDPTAEQFEGSAPYDQGKGCGFLTREPSKRAQKLIERTKMKTDKELIEETPELDVDLHIDRFDIVHDAFKELISVAEILERTSCSLSDVGLDRLSSDLWGASQAIADCVKTLRDAEGDQIHERFQQSQQSCANMLASALAGVELGRNNDTKRSD